MIVVDVNIIAYLLISGEKTVDARALYKLDPNWSVPDLWRDEFLNILATYIRQGGIDLESAGELWQSAVDLFAANEHIADPLMALELAYRHQLSAYDAQYLAVAVELGVKLVTEDRALRRSVPQNSVTMREFLGPTDRNSNGE